MPRLLIVEDDHSLASTLADILERARYATRTALDAASAIKLITDGEFDLMLLDLILPDMSGFDVLRSIREACSTIRSS